MSRKQTLVQLSDDLLAALDQLSARTRRSRSELVREALDRYLADSLDAEIDRRIVEGYRRHPPSDLWGETTARQLIEAEPW